MNNYGEKTAQWRDLMNWRTAILNLMRSPIVLWRARRLFRRWDARSRRKAVALLDARKNPGAVELLLGHVDDGDPGVRCDVAETLGLAGDPRAMGALEGLAATDRAPAVQSAAVNALCQLGEPAEPVLERLMHVPERRGAILRALANARSRLLPPLLNEGPEELRKAIVEALDSNFDAHNESRPHNLLIDLPALNELPRLAVLLRYGGYGMQHAVAEKMAGFRGEAFPYLAAELEGQAPDFRIPSRREPVLKALADIGDPRAVRLLVDRLVAGKSDPEDGVIMALRRSMNANSFDDLVRGLPHLPEIAPLLGELGDERAIPYLRPLLESRHAYLAKDALARLGDPGVIDTLVGELGRWGDYTYCVYVDRLITIGEKHHDAVIRGLIPQLDEKGPHRLWAAAVLIGLRYTPDRALLLEILADVAVAGKGNPCHENPRDLDPNSAEAAVHAIAQAARVPNAVLGYVYDALGYEVHIREDGLWSFDTPSEERGDAAVHEMIRYPSAMTSYFLYRVATKETVKTTLRNGPDEKAYRFLFKNQHRLAKSELARRGISTTGLEARAAVLAAVREGA